MGSMDRWMDGCMGSASRMREQTASFFFPHYPLLFQVLAFQSEPSVPCNRSCPEMLTVTLDETSNILQQHRAEQSGNKQCMAHVVQQSCTLWKNRLTNTYPTLSYPVSSYLSWLSSPVLPYIPCPYRHSTCSKWIGREGVIKWMCRVLRGSRV